MKHMIKDLIVRLYDRKWEEEVLFEMYKTEELRESMLISSGKVTEMEFLIHELNELTKYKSKK